MAGPTERAFENGLFRSRWLMAPMYVGLIVALGILVVVFLREVIDLVPRTLELSLDKAILSILSLIDLTLAANLLLIVMFSGYENFVSRIDVDVESSKDRPGWMGKIDFGGLKLKLIASIVAISAIHLLKRFMEIGKKGPIDSQEMFWLVVIHLTFVVSGVMMALMDWFASAAKKHVQ